MEQNNTTSKKTSRRKKRRSSTLVEEYTRRQGNYRWLETHIWHAKRMKMVEMWGFKLAEHPNEKSIKSSYRASSNLSIIHDASYFGWIRLTGRETVLRTLLNSVTDPTLPSVTSERYLDGKRQCSTFMYSYLQYPNCLVAPINVLWQQTAEGGDVTRNIFIWVHASAFNEALSTLDEAIGMLRLEEVLVIESLQNDLLMFELTGPRSTALLHTVLDICDDSEIAEANTRANVVWKALRNLRSSSSLPPGVVLGLTVFDPRLSFPKKVLPRTNLISEESQKEIQDVLKHWPNRVALSDIWNDERRSSLIRNKVSDAELDKRRSNNLVPGEKLEPLPNDARIPILLVQRGGITVQRTNNRPYSPEYANGWNIVIPAGWGMVFWKSFIFAGAWIGGLRERHFNHFESGLPCFPYDYPGTKSFDEYTLKEKLIAENEYKKRPPAKRPNYSHLQVTSPFEPPFKELLGLESNKIWVLQGATNIQLLNDLIRGSNTALDLSNLLQARLSAQIKEKMNLRGFSALEYNCFLDVSKGLIRVLVDLQGRGVPSRNAIIYKTSEVSKLRIGKKSQFLAESGDWEEAEKSSEDEKITYPPSSDIIGYITTAQYSFRQGHGLAIGCCSLAEILNLQSREQNKSKYSVLVRKATSRLCQHATLELLL